MPYIEGTLPERLQKQTEEHIATCESCARELAELTQTVHALRQAEYPAMEPAFDLRSRVMARLAREPVRRPWFVGRRQAYSGAAVGLLVFAMALTAVWPFLVRARRPASQSRMPSNVQQPAKGPTAAPKPPPGTKAEPYTVIADGHAKDVGILSRKSEAAAPRTGAPPLRFRTIEAPRRTVAPGAPLKKQVGTAARPSPMLAYGGSAGWGKPAGPKAAAGIDEAGIGKIPKAEMEGLPTQPHVNGKGGEVAYGGAAEEAAAKPRCTPAPPPSVPAAPTPAPHGVERIEIGAYDFASSMAASDKFEKQRADETVLACEKKLKESPNSRGVLERLLQAYRAAGRPQDEYATAKRLAKLDPDNAKYWFARASAAERARMPRTAAAAYRQAIKLKLAEPELGSAKRRLQALEAERGTRP